MAVNQTAKQSWQMNYSDTHLTLCQCNEKNPQCKWILMAPEDCLCLPIFRTGMCQGSVSLWLSKTKIGWAAVGTELIFIHSKVLVKHYKIVLKTQIRDYFVLDLNGFLGDMAGIQPRMSFEVFLLLKSAVPTTRV